MDVVFIDDPLELSGSVTIRLLFYFGDLVGEVFFLGLDDADCFFIHEQHVVGGADVGVILPHCLTRPDIQVYFLSRLRNPTRVLEQ